jgi:hypothetical protein
VALSCSGVDHNVGYDVFPVTVKGWHMVAPPNGPLSSPRPATPRAAGGSINGMRILLGLILFVIAVGAVMGVVFAVSSGQWQVGLIIALVAAAFFARVGC